MYHPPSKRRQLLQRIGVYSLMTVTTITLLVILVFVMLGYQFNKADGKIEQGGLVQFGTRPGGATVKIDDSSFGSRTPSKTTETAGTHFFSMSLQGYNTWQKSVDVVAGSVVWLNYARLVPTELTTANVADFKTVSDTKVSPDRKWMAVKENSATSTISLFDLSADTVKKTDLTLPSAAITAAKDTAKQTFVLTDWDMSSRFVLMKHTYDGTKTEWLVVDTRDATKTKNVTRLLDVAASKMKFSNTNNSILYALTNNDIKKIDIDAQTISGPLVRDVADFRLFDRTTITYVTRLSAETKQRSVGYLTIGADMPRTLRTYSDNGKSPLHLALGEYYDERYVAIAYGETVEILKGDIPVSDDTTPSALKTVATMNVPNGADYLSINTDGRFIVAQHGASYSTYDLELSKMSTTALKSKKVSKQELQWLDGYSIWDDQDGSLRLYEFDGANQHTIMPVAPGYTVTLSPNSKYIYGISKDAKGVFHLSRVQMILG